MTDEQKPTINHEEKWEKRRKWHHGKGGGTGGALYCLGLIGALIFFLQQATSFWTGVLGVLKALIWPAFLVYELFKFLGCNGVVSRW